MGDTPVQTFITGVVGLVATGFMAFVLLHVVGYFWKIFFPG